MRDTSGVLQQHVFAGDGEMQVLMRNMDWSSTPVGPVETWPQTLVGFVRMILEMPSPAIIFWGSHQTQIYNAGYATIMGPRHPTYLGASYRECWPDTYPTIYPWMRRVLDEGDVIQVENEHITVTRYGFEEEAYFSFTFSPLRNDEGAIQGIFQPVFEVTGTVLEERRTEMIRSLEPRGGSRGSVQELTEAIAAHPWDIPLAVFWLWKDGLNDLELAGTTQPLDPAAMERIRGVACSVSATQRPQPVDDLRTLLGELHVGPWAESARRGWVLPMAHPAVEAARGVAFFALSPRLHFDDRYRRFLELTAARVVMRLAQNIARAARRRETERRRQYLNDLFNQAPAAFAVLRGPQHVFELANPLYLRLIGEQRDVVGKPIREALPELNGQPFLDILDEVFRTGEAFVGTELPADLDRLPAGGTEQAFFNFIYQPMYDPEGSVEGILIFVYEVTEQVQARQRVESLMEELQREHRRKDEFLAMLAHELRNPLAAVHNAITLLEGHEAASVSPVDGYVGVLRRQTGTLASLVDDLLDVSRITRGLVELNREPVDLVAVAHRALENVHPLMIEKGHRVRIALPGESVALSGDSVRLEQILVNLLNNAAKFTDPGGNISLTLAKRAGVAEIEVKDDGIGIEPDTVEQMFTLFGQSERGLDRSQGGLGIGLTIVRNLVELHGGTVAAHSAGPGQGSEFVVTLPLDSSQPEVAPPREALPAAAGEKKCRVLVVDDNRDAANTLMLLLRAAGHQVAVAYDGPTALVTAVEHRPDVVLLDIGLPGMDGLEVARRLRQIDVLEATRIAAMTGYGQQHDRERTAQADIDAHFVKPVGLAQLTAFIDGAS